VPQAVCAGSFGANYFDFLLLFLNSVLHRYYLTVGCGVKCGSLKDKKKREEFVEETAEEYEEIREEHYDSLKVKSAFIRRERYEWLHNNNNNNNRLTAFVPGQPG